MSEISKTISNRIFELATYAIFLVFASPHHIAAQTSQAGFFSIVNAVSLQTNTVVSVDGKSLRPDGLKPGKVTGGLGFPAGSHRVDATNSDCKPSSLSLQLSPSASPLLIIYSLESRNTSGQIAHELRLFSRPNSPPSNRKALFAIYAGQSASRVISFNGQPMTLQPLREVSLANTSSVEVAENGQSIGRFAAEEAGNYVVVLFDKGPSLSGILAEDIIFKQAGQR